LDSVGGTREAGKDHLNNLGSTREPGKDQLDRHQGGRKGPIGQPARRQGSTREAGIWTAWEAPGRHQGLLKAILCYLK